MQVLGSQDLNAEAKAGTSDFTRGCQHDGASCTSVGTSARHPEARPASQASLETGNSLEVSTQVGQGVWSLNKSELHPPPPHTAVVWDSGARGGVR